MTLTHDLLDIISNGAGLRLTICFMLYKTELCGKVRKRGAVTAEGPRQTLVGGINRTRLTASPPHLYLLRTCSVPQSWEAFM